MMDRSYAMPMIIFFTQITKSIFWWYIFTPLIILYLQFTNRTQCFPSNWEYKFIYMLVRSACSIMKRGKTSICSAWFGYSSSLLTGALKLNFFIWKLHGGKSVNLNHVMNICITSINELIWSINPISLHLSHTHTYISNDLVILTRFSLLDP